MAARYRFPFARAVPADDPLAQWVTALGLGFNDLVHSHERLFEGLAGDAPAVVEVGYDARLAGSHVWEVCKLLRAGTSNPDRREDDGHARPGCRACEPEPVGAAD